MSEYQYYEFTSIDRSLTRAEMAELRAVSSRAVITPTSFVTWLETWSNDDMKAVLKHIATGQEREAERQVKSRYATWLKAQGPSSSSTDAGRGVASGYDGAVNILTDLAEGYALVSSRVAFERDLERFLVAHTKRRALLQRLAQAGLWSE